MEKETCVIFFRGVAGAQGNSVSRSVKLQHHRE
jgi:hypothetical protein